jgi:hypothetical protein
MRKLIVWGTFLSGAAAAFLMYRRGASIGTIASRATLNPIGSLVNELGSKAS